METIANSNTPDIKVNPCLQSYQEKLLIRMPESQNKHYDISAFIRETNHLMSNHENHFSMLIAVMKKCQRVVALGNLENVPLEKSEVNFLLYQLFELETKFEKVEIIEFNESE